MIIFLSLISTDSCRCSPPVRASAEWQSESNPIDFEGFSKGVEFDPFIIALIVIVLMLTSLTIISFFFAILFLVIWFCKDTARALLAFTKQSD